MPGLPSHTSVTMPRIQYVVKRFKSRSVAQIRAANEIIAEYKAAGFELTLRQLYYQFVARDLIPNTEKSYKNLGDLISDARLAGLIDWDAIHDRNRFLRGNSHWDGPEEIVQACADQFHVDLWHGQSYRPEVWVEKDALVGVVEKACRPLDVPFLSCRGYTSQSEMWRAGRRLMHYSLHGQTPIVIHLGDHDPSGIDMTRDITERLCMFAERDIEVRRIALNMDQIEEYSPPPNPAKVTDSRFEAYREKYGDDSWELDALEPQVIVDLIEDTINEIRDERPWKRAVRRQDKGREQLSDVASNWESVLSNL